MSCEEENPPIKFTERPLLDTTYMSAVPTAQIKKVFLADVTGVRCNNCPRAALRAADLEAANPGRIEIMAIYPTYKPLSNPWGPPYDTLNTQDADDLANSVGVVSALPSGIIDNMLYNSKRLIDENSWSVMVDGQLKNTTPINIDIYAKWLTADNKGRIEVKATANKAITNGVSWVIAILEDDIVGKQSTATGTDDNYTFKHVLRKIVNSPLGDPLQTPMVAGFTTEKHYYIPRIAKWKPENLSCMVWVFDNTTKEILQVNNVKFSL
ncbi:MAG: Omp28-related outer membrane protein [Crocinitomicaceae bacterium]|nr:Omp28-related outer membrane protein [Crocinitomicaceae bacterium]